MNMSSNVVHSLQNAEESLASASCQEGGQDIDIIDLEDDIILLISSYLGDAKDLLGLALSCRRFGAKMEYYQGRSLMEEAAMRGLTKHATQQQIECIPREEGESWIGLYNIPPKIDNWRSLNLYKAVGDRSPLMDYMNTGDLGLGRLTMFDFAKYDVFSVLKRLNYEHGLLCLTMEKDEDSDKNNPGLSSGHDWPRTENP